MPRLLSIVLLAFAAGHAAAEDSLKVSLNKTLFLRGDTLDFSCVLPDALSRKLPTATLNVWIEDIGRNKRWKYRYPILNGEVSASPGGGEHSAFGRDAGNVLGP